MARKRVLLKFDKDPGQVAWAHLSQKDNTVIVRFLRGGDDGLPIEWEERRFMLPPDQGRLDELCKTAREVPIRGVASGVGIDSPQKWHELFGALEGIQAVGAEAHPTAYPDESSAVSVPVTIPVTPLRELYKAMRLLGMSEQQGLVKESDVGELFRRSLSRFLLYRNIEPYQPTSASWTRFHDQPDRFSHCLAARCEEPRGDSLVLVEGDQRRMVRFVGKEISPLRTTGGAVSEDGTSGKKSGQGGVDLLLADNDGHLIVGEIKARNDTNMLVAIVQALTYVVELTTPAQAMRLKRSYPEALSNLALDDTGCRCDIWLIHEAGYQPKLLEEARSLATSLMRAEESAIAGKVDHIKFVTASLAGRGVALTCTESIELATPDHA